MNWLAHLYLSEPDPAFRIGNLLPDMLPTSQLADLPEKFQRGIRQHRRIDAFTDAHPIVKQSIQRIDPPFRRYGGILVDVFYDHILACEWPAYSEQPLSDFAAEVYGSFETLKHHLPPDATTRFDRMISADLLCSYREIGGIATALERIDSRLRRQVHLAEATHILERNRDAFRADFETFFPELRAHVRVQME